MDACIYNRIFIFYISVSSEGLDDGRPERCVHHRQHSHHGQELPEAQESQEALVPSVIIIPLLGAIYLVILKPTIHLFKLHYCRYINKCFFVLLVLCLPRIITTTSSGTERERERGLWEYVEFFSCWCVLKTACGRRHGPEDCG